ncbi:hypothetical protein MNBD_CHLOROFLEXI01-1408 [hydrothermal vent metagenome]|uniref:Uncharacterized protein n=1 Tax=hydrothermal vent metagenome TaxID=652676 RepID=A0A3B0USC7_9ZZZZ
MLPKDVELWHIYLVKNCHHVKPQPKDKFIVAVGYNGSEQFWGFLINSRIGPFLQSKPELLNCEASIVANQHRRILRTDSFIDCTSLYSFYAWDFSSHKGEISQDAMITLMKAVRACVTLKTKLKRMILKNGGEDL